MALAAAASCTGVVLRTRRPRLRFTSTRMGPGIRTLSVRAGSIEDEVTGTRHVLASGLSGAGR